MARRRFDKGEKVYGVEITSVYSNGKSVMYFYKCNCGKTGKGSASFLKKRKCKGCSGYSNGYAFGSIVSDYKLSAKSRGLPFELDESDFGALINSNCFYCNSVPSNIKKRYKGKIIYNGIDRVNNAIGYCAGNCVTCCIVCNRAKGIKDKDEFLDWIKRVYEHSVKENENQ